MALFFSMVTLFWGGMHLYVASRIFSSLRLGGYGQGWPAALPYLVAALLVFFSMGSLFLIRKVGNISAAGNALTIAAYGYMGIFFTFLFLVLVRDLGWLVWSAGARILGLATGLGAEPLLPSPARRALLFNATHLAAAVTTGGLAVTGFRSAMQLPPYKRVTLRFPNLPPGLEGFRIAQITDIHIGAPLNRAQLAAIVAKTNELGADMIALTGDLVDGSVKTYASEVAPIGDLKAAHGVYFVTGNHEYYSGHRAWCDEVARLGLTVLNNEHRIVSWGGARLLVGGVTDFTGGQFDPDHASDPKKALAGAAQHDFRLLLAHQPKSIPAAREAGFDLQISGHTHGGQFFPGPLFVGLFNPLAAGLGHFGKLQCYVSRGTGCWGPPFRVGSPPEITEITLARG
jgi:predicted MPP superfamily phosphohydrolase